MAEFKTESAVQQQTQPKFAASDILGAFAICADILVTIFIIVGMAQDKNSVTVSILSGVAFFFAFGALVILVLSGTLSAIATAWFSEVTIRQRDALPYRYAQATQKAIPAAHVVPPMQIGYAGDTGPLRLPDAPSYVPAVPPAGEQLKLACYQFVRALFDEEGKPNPKRILAAHTKSPGLVQYEKPKADVMAYLCGLQMVWENERKQLFFNVPVYPTLRYCMNAIRLEVPAGRVEPPPSTPPLYHERREV